MVPCTCPAAHEPRRVVLTGGPGAGKTALLELVRQSFCSHVAVLAESAGVVFGGGFPRVDEPEGRRAAQRAIYHVQRELEVIGAAHNPAVVLCDRGTVDGVAYWPAPAAGFWPSVATTQEVELARYAAVVHMRTPRSDEGYNRDNPLRTESPAVAAAIDDRILEAWEPHPRRFVVDAAPRFIDKAARTLEILRGEVPECCRVHELATPSGGAAS